MNDDHKLRAYEWAKRDKAAVERGIFVMLTCIVFGLLTMLTLIVIFYGH